MALSFRSVLLMMRHCPLLHQSLIAVSGGAAASQSLPLPLQCVITFQTLPTGTGKITGMTISTMERVSKK